MKRFLALISVFSVFIFNFYSQEIQELQDFSEAGTEEFLPDEGSNENSLQEKVHIIQIDLRNLEEAVYQMSAGEVYLMTLNDNFEADDVTETQIFMLHYFFMLNPENQLFGPIDYIYFDKMQSRFDFYELRTKIQSSNRKFVCVDIGDSSYNLENAILPVNCFSNHENLYWVYFGSLNNQKITDGICSNLPNLKKIFMWDCGDISENAFLNLPEKVTVCDYDGEIYLKDFILSRKQDLSWDYFAFTQDDKPAPDENMPRSSKNAASDYDSFGYENYYSDEEPGYTLRDYYYDSMDALKFQNSGAFELSKQNFSDFALSDVDFSDRNAVAKKFLSLYLLKDAEAGEVVAPGLDLESIEMSFNPNYTSIRDLGGNVKVYIYNDPKDSDEEQYKVVDEDNIRSIIFGISGTYNDDEIYELGILEMSCINEKWYVSEVESFVLLSFLISDTNYGY